MGRHARQTMYRSLIAGNFNDLICLHLQVELDPEVKKLSKLLGHDLSNWSIS